MNFMTIVKLNYGTLLNESNAPDLEAEKQPG